MSSGTDMGGFSSRGVPSIIVPKRNVYPFGTRQSLLLDLDQKFGFIPGIERPFLRYGSSDFDDFTTGSVTTGLTAGAKTLVTVSGTGAGVSVQPDTSNASGSPYAQGQIRISGGSSSGSRAALFGACVDGTHGTLCLGRGWLAVSHLFSVTTLSGSSDTYTYHFGISVSGATSGITDSIGAQYTNGTNGGAWQIAVSAASGAYTANGPTAVAIGSHNAVLVINPQNTAVWLFVSFNGGPFIFQCTYTGTMPTSLIMFGMYARVILSTYVSNGGQFLYDGWQWDHRGKGLR